MKTSKRKASMGRVVSPVADRESTSKLTHVKASIRPIVPVRAQAVRASPTVNLSDEPVGPRSAASTPRSALVQSWSSCVPWFRDRLKNDPGWPVSLVLHLVVLLLLASILLPRRNSEDNPEEIVGQFGNDPISLDGTEIGFEPLILPAGDPRATATNPGAESHAGQPEPSQFPDRGQDDLSLPIVLPTERESDTGRPADSRARTARPAQRKGAAGKSQGPVLAGLLDGRGQEARAKLVKSGGGTKESEDAVELGLSWLARHQRPDGSWSFQHGPDDPGMLDCPTGATGLALLAFLGAGNTHMKGEYRSHVNLGLSYLVSQMQIDEKGGWLQGTGQATMYVQGIGAIALCEAYSMTKDPALQRPAQAAIDFIVNAQDSDGGGWRYQIPQAGDTSVVGWQVMALQSAKIAELNVPPRVLTGVTKFLKSVEAGGGGLYGYTHSGSVRNSTTAVGLLCRMYLGRDLAHRGMSRGIANLSKWGPNVSDMYYSYYATQVMHHAGGSSWREWNSKMRDQVVRGQTRVGNSAGSWITDRSHGSNRGGRLYTTCLSILTLEVYYRHLSLYRRPNVTEEIPDEL
jgi:hypothetical protein